MRGKKNFKSKFVTVVIAIIVILVIVLAVGGISKCSTVKDKVNDIINPTFSVEFDGKTYKGDDNVIFLPDSGQVVFYVKNGGNYRVEVKPNVTAETDFNYYVGDRIYPYSGEDLTASFINSKQIFNDMFVIDCSQPFDLQSVLSRVWGGAEVTVTIPEDIWLYKLVVTSSSGETVSFLFGGTIKVVLSETSIII